MEWKNTGKIIMIVTTIIASIVKLNLNTICNENFSDMAKFKKKKQ